MCAFPECALPFESSSVVNMWELGVGPLDPDRDGQTVDLPLNRDRCRLDVDKKQGTSFSSVDLSTVNTSW